MRRRRILDKTLIIFLTSLIVIMAASVVCAFSAAGMSESYSGYRGERVVYICLFGILIISACVTVGHVFNGLEKALYIAVLLLFILAALPEGIVWIYKNFGEWLSIGIWAIYPGALLPLLSLPFSKMIARREAMSDKNLFRLLILMFVPIAACILSNPEYAVWMILVCSIVVIVLKREKRISLKWDSLAIIGFLILALLNIYFFCLSGASNYYAERLMSVFGRGSSDPFGYGWTRTAIDRVFAGSGLFGVGITETDVDTWLASGCYNIVFFLGRFGWVPFLLLMAVFGLFFAMMVRMVKTVRYSLYARYCAIFSIAALLVQAGFNIVGVFLLDSGLIDMPLMVYNMYTASVDYILIGIVLHAYMRQRKFDRDERKRAAEPLQLEERLEGFEVWDLK